MWQSKGLIFDPTHRSEWMVSHASLPVAIHLQGDIYRVYFSTRNARQQSQLGFVELNIHEPQKMLRVSKYPCLEIGKLGAFDCDGIYATSIIFNGDEVRCYYGGWNAGQHGLFYSSIGMAISSDGGETFTKVCDYPILTRDQFDYWAVLAPSVLKEDNLWKMWYVSGKDLYYHDNHLQSVYDIKYACSSDGMHWKKTGECSFALEEDEKNIGRVCVLPNDMGVYKAWCSVVKKQKNTYQLAFSESVNGINFIRKDNLFSFQSSEQPWDRDVQAYPWIIDHQGQLYMFYNGRNYGKDGIGIAVCRGL